MPKCPVQTLRGDSKLDAPSSSHTCAGSYSADVALDSYALVLLNM